MNPPEPHDTSTNTTNSLIHLYRGELGRMTSYRVRLDTTTNWAIVTLAGITTFALGNAEVSHAVFLFAMLLLLVFLDLEARRFRIYEVSHQRVRLLERGFYQQALGGAAEAGWREALRSSLETPRSPISRSSALGWRLRRTYLWLYSALILGWLSKLRAASPAEMVAQAHLGPLPGWLVVALVGGFYLALAALALLGSRAYPVGAD